MTDEKARDFFSAYYEGTLEAGLCVSFEQKLKTDWSLKEEYQQFVRALDELGTLKFEEIEIPHDLHERISARIDRHIYERKQAAKPGLFVWLRGLAYAGIGVLAILGAIWAMNGHSATTGAGVVSGGSDRIQFSASDRGVVVEIAPATSKPVTVLNQGKVVSRNDVGPAGLKTLLSNSQPSASVFEIQVSGQTESFVAVPGSVRSGVNMGEGTSLDLIKAAADFYRTPVRLEGVSPDLHTTWQFESADAVAEVSRAVGPGCSVTLLQNGILEIAQK